MVLQSTLDVDGAVNLNGVLDVDGVATLASAVIEGAASVGGNQLLLVTLSSTAQQQQ